MKKTIRCVLAFICCFTLLFGTLPVSAKETNEPVRGDEVSARWWTENPNPAPGTIVDFFSRLLSHGPVSPSSFVAFVNEKVML